jgi:O-antigen/teichoic acid export membrane protein
VHSGSHDEEEAAAARIGRGRGAGAPLLSRTRRWFGKAAWAVGDQAVFSFTGFIINVLLARWLTPEQYGAFAIAFSIYFLLAAFHNAAIVEPMMIFGSGKYATQWRGYVGTVVRAHFVVTGAIGLLLALVGLFLYWYAQPLVAPTLITLGLTAPVLLIIIVARRACYVEGRVRTSAISSGIYLTVAVAGFATLKHQNSLSAVAALLIMGLASLVGAAVIAIHTRTLAHAGPAPAFGTIATEHWGYARWASAATAMNWIPSNVFFFALPASGGLAASGAFRALLNLIQPPLQLQQAIGTVALPSLVRSRTRAEFGRMTSRLTWLFVGCGLAYSLPIALFRRQIVDLAYHGRYAAWSDELLPLLLLPILLGPISGAILTLQALERPRGIFLAWASGAALAVILGVPLAMHRGLPGASVGILVAYLATCVVVIQQKRIERRASGSGKQATSELVTTPDAF